MIKKIFAVLAVIVLAILGLALTKADSFAVKRSIAIKAPADKLYPMVADFHRWTEWSPWEGLDPKMKRTHSGPASGLGAVYAWDGNDDVGSGRMEITAAQAPGTLSIKLNFIKPFEASNLTDFSFTPQGDGTLVTWVMTGPTPFVSKLIQVFVSMDKLIGKDFEAGLAKMKAAAEK